MRKIFLTTLLGILTMSLFAQELEDIQDRIQKGKWKEAQEKVDKYLANEKNAKKPEGWYYKAVIYDNISKDSTLKSVSADPKGEAFAAYKKYVDLDPKLVLGTLYQHITLFDLFYSYNDLAINAFNAKSFDAALENFKKAAAVEDYIVQKGYAYNSTTLPKLDTSLILNTAAAAIQAKKTDEAVIYYGKLADARLASKDYLEVYEYLVNYYNTKKDVANRNKYMAVGRELFPTDAYWCEVELMDAGDDKQKRFAKYDELLKGSCNNYIMRYNYGAELFNYIYTQEKKPADYIQMQAKIEELLKSGIAVQSTPEINLLMARHLYNNSNDISDMISAIKGTKPEDVKKKNDLKAQLNTKLEDLLKYATAASDAYQSKGSLKPGEKGNYKVATNLILYYYETKNNKEKMKEYQDKMKAMQ
jgi:hypothetical protein